MKPYQYYVTLILGVVCLIMSVVVNELGRSNQRLRVELQSQQAQINKGQALQQVGTNILRDMANASGTNTAMRSELANDGYTVTINNPVSGTSTPSKP